MRRRASYVGFLALALGGMVRADAPSRPRLIDLGRIESGPDQMLSSLDQEQKSLKGELGALGAQEDATQRRLILRGRMMYRLVRVGLLPAGGGFDSLLDHATKMERVRRGLEQDVAESQALSVRKVMLLHKLDDLATRRAPLELEREAASKARALLGEAEDRKQSFERAFETSTGAGDYVAIYGGGLPGPEAPSASSTDFFRAMKGRLPFPLAGRAEIRVVRRAGASGPGLEMYAPVGTPVRAVAAGRVAFADRYDPFGQIVILDHGDRYYTLMGDLASIDVRVGDDLSAGAKIGAVGLGESSSSDKSKSGGSSLYFEVRHGSTTVEPGSWFGL